MTDTMTPIVHSNGTSRDELLLQLRKAFAAIDAAVLAVQATAPNGRDYYPRGDHAIHIATGQHRDRLYRLQAVSNELDLIYDSIAKEKGAA